MKPILQVLALVFCPCAAAQQSASPPAGQNPPGTPLPAQQQQQPQQPQRPAQQQQQQPGQQPGNQIAPKPAGYLPGNPPSLPPFNPAEPLTLQNALDRARVFSQQVYSANLATLIAHEDTVQAKAGLLPQASYFSQFIYTQPNGTASGVFVANDGPHIYSNWITVHGEIYNPAKFADYHKTQLAEAIAHAKADLAGRGLIATVVQNYYAMAVAARKLLNAQTSEAEAQRLVDITQKQEAGGEVSHYDTVKARSQLLDRQRDVQEAKLAIDKARIGFSVLLFPDFRQDFSVVDDLDTTRPLPPFPEIEARASNGPDVRAAQATVEQQGFEIKSAKAGYLPILSFDYFYGMNANQLAIHNSEGQLLLGNVAQVQATVPIWTWGANRSKVRQAELKLQQARADLSLTQRQLLSNLNSFYLEAQVASAQIALLRESRDLAAEALRLTLLRYQAGEGTILEVVDAQSTLAQARNNYDDGLSRYRLAVANLQTLTGAF